MGNKSLNKFILFFNIVVQFVSCKQSCFDVITQNDVAYWTFNWTLKEPYGSIMEFSKKDSTMKYLDNNWIYDNHTPALWGLKFRISNDTLFEYVNRRGVVITYDTLPIISYSKNKIVIKNRESEHDTWHLVPSRYARRAVDLMNTPGQVKLSVILKTPIANETIMDIFDVTWKLFGYGDVSSGEVQKSETLKYGWLNMVRFYKDGNMIGFSTVNNLHALYVISGSNMSFLSFENSKQNENYDGDQFCNALTQCKEYKITENWLQLFYDDGKKYLLFKVSKSPTLSKKSVLDDPLFDENILNY